MPSFLNPLRREETTSLVLRNQRNGTVVATCLLPALASAARRTGLLEHERLDSGVAMIIAPTNAIHTFFMRFPIDVAFVTRDGRIVKIVRDLPPWRIAGAWRGHAVIEMAAGSFDAAQALVGDELVIEPAS